MQAARHWNLSELFFDASVLFYSLVVHHVVLRGRHLTEFLSPAGAFYAYLALSFFLPWFLGSIYRRFADSPRALRLAALGSGCAFILFTLLYNTFQGVQHSTFSGLPGLAIVAASACPLLGIVMAAGENVRSDKLSPLQLRVVLLGLSLLSFAVIYGIGWLSNQKADGLVAAAAVIGMMLGVAAGFVAVFYLSLGLMRLSDSLPSWLRTGGEVFPAIFIGSLFIVWNEYMISFLRATDIGSAGLGAVITTLCFNGFLPCRIALLSAPPVRPVNVAVGIIALITYIAGLA